MDEATSSKPLDSSPRPLLKPTLIHRVLLSRIVRGDVLSDAIQTAGSRRRYPFEREMKMAGKKSKKDKSKKGKNKKKGKNTKDLKLKGKKKKKGKGKKGKDSKAKKGKDKKGKGKKGKKK
ncbi:hypothetical protein [Allorhodopirellula solitaria]|nr:hypothetical protein [Allorhodopirellula solitaria]